MKIYNINKFNYNLTYNYIPLIVKKHQIQEAKTFAPLYAKKRLSVYQNRAQNDLQNITDQAYTSKLAEFMVYNHLVSIMPHTKVSVPSCEIYDRPSFDDDLVVSLKDKNVKVHVKSHDISRISVGRPLSWGFQKEDPIFKYKANDLMMLVVYVNENEGHLVSKNFVKKYESFLAPAKSPKLVSKQFVYYSPEINIG